jgi:PAS domain S-box-containing protein
MLETVPDGRDIELQSLRERLAEAEDILRAIRAGEIDAVIVNREDTPAIYTLQTADSPYRLLVEQMREGALTLSGDGIILYCNPAFAQMVGIPSDRLRASPLIELIANPAQANLAKVVAPGGASGLDLRLRTSSGEIRHVYVSSAPLTAAERSSPRGLANSPPCAPAVRFRKNEGRTPRTALTTLNARAAYGVYRTDHHNTHADTPIIRAHHGYPMSGYFTRARAASK